MDAYTPLGATTRPWLAVVLMVEFLLGFFLQRSAPGKPLVALAWLLQGLGLAAALKLLGPEPPGLRMLSFIAVLFLGMKAVVATQGRLSGKGSLSFLRWSAFALAWPGMDPGTFIAPRIPRQGVGILVFQGVAALTASSFFFLATKFLALNDGGRIPTLVLFFIGASLAVHFGLFTLSAAFWRTAGFDCSPLFLNPFRTRSLGEFWAKRWNVGFSQMAATVAYRPLAGKAPSIWGLLGAFGLSGLLHEAAISLPVQAGFGLPTFYFLLHGVLVAVEHGRSIQAIDARQPWSTIWSFFWLLLPLPLLFHRPFLEGVVGPLIGAIP
jgi:hypothetical protein